MDLVNQYLAHDTPYCTFELDEYRDAEGHQMILAHLRVHQWSKKALQKIKHDWAVFRKAVTTPLYATPMQEDPKWVKFVTLMGWRPTGQRVLCNDNIERPLYIHTV